MFKKRFLAIISLMLFSSGLLAALEWKSVSPSIAFVWRSNADIGCGLDARQPSRLYLKPGLVFSADIQNGKNKTYMEPAVWFSWAYEEIKDGIPRSAGPENAAHMQVLGVTLDVPVGYALNFKKISIGVQGGLALDLNFPILEAQLGTAESSDFWSAYYLSARFLKLSLGTWIRFPVSSMDDLIVGLRALYPLANLWVEAAPVSHELELGISVSFPFAIKK